MPSATITISAMLRTLSDFDLDVVRKAVETEGRKRGRVWAQHPSSGFGRRRLASST